jgi:hypothetical protein
MRILFLFLLLFPAAIGHTQLSGGFVAGMNFSRFSGPLEMDGRGRDLEEFKFKTGFHVGGGLNLRMTEMAGFRVELLYAQKGTEYTYSGPSYWVFTTGQGKDIFSTGTRKTFLKIVNHYLELPLVAYARIGRLEFGGGGYFSYLISSTGTGDLTYDGVIESGFIIAPFSIVLDFNYFSDPFEQTGMEETQSVQVGGQAVQVPESIGAQYEVVSVPNERLFRRWDYGLIGNLALYLNQGLHLGFRLNYGLQDLTREERDISRAELDADNRPIFRNDFDRNVTLQVSIGFSF